MKGVWVYLINLHHNRSYCSEFDFFFFGNRLQSLVSIIYKVKGQVQLVMKSRPEGKGNQDEEDREEEEKET